MGRMNILKLKTCIVTKLKLEQLVLKSTEPQNVFSFLWYFVMDNVVTVTLTVPSSGSPVLTKSCILYRKCVSFKGDENDLCTITICSNR